MAICSDCTQEMTTAPSCWPWGVRVGGRVLAAVRFGRERVHVVGIEEEYDEEELWDDGLEDYLPAPPPVPFPVPPRCGDCGVRPGAFHHPGCDVAECPGCGGQLLTCSCCDAAADDEGIVPLGVPR